MTEQPKRKYLLSDKPQRGLLRILRIQTDKTLLLPSEDIQNDIIQARFKLDLEMFPCQELQKEYTEIGLELFSIEPYLVVDDPKADLVELCKAERAKLQSEGVPLYT